MSLTPDPKMHRVWSLAKSGLRIGFCVAGMITGSLILVAAGIAAAELFGVIEEFA